MKLNLPLELVHRGQVFHTDRFGCKVYITDHGYDDLERIDSAEFVLNHSQRISVVTGTSSIYGISEENTASQYTPILPLDARNHPRHRPRKTFETGRSQSRIAWDQIYIRAL